MLICSPCPCSRRWWNSLCLIWHGWTIPPHLPLSKCTWSWLNASLSRKRGAPRGEDCHLPPLANILFVVEGESTGFNIDFSECYLVCTTCNVVPIPVQGVRTCHLWSWALTTSKSLRVLTSISSSNDKQVFDMYACGLITPMSMFSFVYLLLDQFNYDDHMGRANIESTMHHHHQ
jgi:hypothetical protein